MSWAGGWFFLMAAEIFTVGQRDFRLPGIGGYLSEAARLGDLSAISQGLLVLIAMISLLDQVVWRPLLVWSERFKLDTVGSAAEPSSWFLGAWRNSRVIAPAIQRVLSSVFLRLDRMIGRLLADGQAGQGEQTRLQWHSAAAAIIGGGVLLYGLYRGCHADGDARYRVGNNCARAAGHGCKGVRGRAHRAGLTVPLGVAIGTKPGVAAWLQPLVQIAASVPATALFPVLLLGLLGCPPA